jgi:hypothetical protein
VRVAGRRAPDDAVAFAPDDAAAFAPDDAAAFAPVVELLPVVGRARDAPGDAAGLDVDVRDEAPDAVEPDRGADFDPDDPRAGPVPGRAGAPGRGGRREDGMPPIVLPRRPRPREHARCVREREPIDTTSSPAAVTCDGAPRPRHDPVTVCGHAGARRADERPTGLRVPGRPGGVAARPEGQPCTVQRGNAPRPA